jgi:hypothetical protein
MKRSLGKIMDLVSETEEYISSKLHHSAEADKPSIEETLDSVIEIKEDISLENPNTVSIEEIFNIIKELKLPHIKISGSNKKKFFYGHTDVSILVAQVKYLKSLVM